jgi:hypothetical protein
MNSLTDPSYFLQLSESFIKIAKLQTSGDRPRLTALREISSAELAAQSNPIVQIADEGETVPIRVSATLSLGETVYQSCSFEKIGFSTLTEFIVQKGPDQLSQYELGVFQQSDGMPAPTASPTPLDLVFCGFSSKTIPELFDAFPNLDCEPTSITLSALDQFRFLKSQCKVDEPVLLVEIGNERTHLFLIGSRGLEGIQTLDLGRQALYGAMAEVLHLHYIGSAIKLFMRSGFDSTEIGPKLGNLFGSAIQSILDDQDWKPNTVHITGLLRSQKWFQDAVLMVLNLEAFQIDRSLLPFDVDESLGDFSSMDTEIAAKIFAGLTLDEDYSWHSDFLSSLNKSDTIPRRQPSGSNPPFPTAHPDRMPEIPVAVSVEQLAPVETPPEAVSVYAPPPPTVVAPSRPTVVAPSPPLTERPVISAPPVPVTQKSVEAIPSHLLNDIEEYEGEFEDNDDYGGGRGHLAVKTGLLFLSVIIIGVMVTVVFFPKISERYLGITPPHVDFYDSEPDLTREGSLGSPPSFQSSAEMTEVDVATGLQNLRDERESMSYGGLFLPTSPSGATVRIGDMSPKLSPIKLPNVAPGIYEVVISKDGYETVTMTVTIDPKDVKKIDTVILKRRL